ncbi:hypothetical protein BRE01_05990 [Brevibacillus reuszeri]|uniref:Uncharacterized protein n=1 Tax=Brevibacillus reuszeri TaxID=54915 RepID=A0A0K9YQG3_9BACL|nr:hypothetical protein [Brevibacillus reuszeri]KNB70877.1 hypothetical protein ADS79_18720 [Brevibacillus reuszeri]MED1857275.1 hypothetical protein [Brevibacillus reuszeri]GED66897.1 hypothetical protein BRE01_05990 [Brevibacillus reuszeri]
MVAVDVADVDVVEEVVVAAHVVVHAVVHAVVVARAVVHAAASVPAHAVAFSSFRYPTVVIRIIEKISLPVQSSCQAIQKRQELCFFMLE